MYFLRQGKDKSVYFDRRRTSISGVSAFLLAHMPLAMDLLGFQGATSNSGNAMLGVSAIILESFRVVG